jgi:hypothetical protein
MLWAMLGTMVAFWALFAALFAIVVLLRRRNRARKRGWTAATGNTPGAFSRLHDPAKSPPNINPKTGAPF